MMKQNKSSFELVPSPCKSHASMQSRRTDPSSSSLHINKYSYNSKPNHTLSSDHYAYDNCTSTNNLHDNHKKPMYCNGNYNNDNEKLVYGYGKYSYSNDTYKYCSNNTFSKDNHNNYTRSKNNHNIEHDEDNFTFSSVAGSMESFNFKSPACTHEAEGLLLHGRLSMSSADELFQDGKIRPLMHPIINGRDQPNHTKPIINSQDQPNRTKPIINGHDQRNLSMPMLDDSNAQSVISANDSVIKQALDAKTAVKPIISASDTVIKQGFDAKTVENTVQGFMQKEKLDHGLSSEINQRLKEICREQILISEVNYSELHSSLSAPASPVKDFLANGKLQGSNEAYSVISTSQVSCYKRCRSLTRVFQIEDNEQIIEVEDIVENGTSKGDHLNKRNTLQDLLDQEEKPIIKPKMMKKKHPGLETPHKESEIYSHIDAVISRPSLAPAPINIPQLWPVKEKLLAPPTSTNKKKVAAPSPHGLHYASQKAQAERMKKKTFLPYRPVLLGCLGYPPHLY